MRVQFRRLYFGPNGFRYKPGVVHENIPPAWFGTDLKGLPKGAKVFPEPPVVPPVEDKKLPDKKVGGKEV